MTLQNRVSPNGDIVADPSRGQFMGNRGILHDSNKRLGQARWRHKNWVTCVLKYGTTRRELMYAGSYTELFFLDEVTSLAAGHRPCAQCRRADFNAFVQSWVLAHELTDRPSSKDIDAALHLARVDGSQGKTTYEADLNSLPDGTMFQAEEQIWLVWRGFTHRWSFNGYMEKAALRNEQVEVLTPKPTVAVLGAGYKPHVHASASV